TGRSLSSFPNGTPHHSTVTAQPQNCPRKVTTGQWLLSPISGTHRPYAVTSQPLDCPPKSEITDHSIFLGDYFSSTVARATPPPSFPLSIWPRDNGLPSKTDGQYLSPVAE
ncbi:unnamed protein product, partial [Ixodes pacificus]